MRVLLTHPYFWPYVTRGAEREIHGLGSRLANRGHRVRLVTGRPDGLTSSADVDGIRVRYVRTPLPAPLARRGWRRESMFAVPAGLVAATASVDVVLSFYYADVVGVRALRPRCPLVLKLTGAVPRERVAGQRVEHALLRRALERADEVWVNSQYVADVMAGWGRIFHVLPAGVDLDLFHPCAERTEAPLVACTAAPSDPRKRLVDVLDAWPAVLEAVPRATLVLAQQVDRATQRALLDRLPPSLHRTVQFVGSLDGPSLAGLYSRAWVTVAPAVHEALGLATLESLACGTAVAGADSGATRELISDARLGRLFPAAQPQECADAIISILSDTGERAPRRAAAARYSWPGIAGEVEARLEKMAR